MKRSQSSPICGDCMKLHRRLVSAERLERRSAIMAQLAARKATPTAYDYAEALFDHLTLSQKVKEPGPKYKPAPAVPAAWSGAQLEYADRLVLSTLHLWQKPKGRQG